MLLELILPFRPNNCAGERWTLGRLITCNLRVQFPFALPNKCSCLLIGLGELVLSQRNDGSNPFRSTNDR